MTLPESYHSNDPTSSIPATMQSTYSHSSTASLSMITQSQGELTRSLEMLRSDRDAMRKRIEELEEKLKVYESANSGSVLSVPATMLASPGFTGASAPSTSRVRVTPTMRSLLPASRLAGGSGIGPGRSSSNSRALIGSTGGMSPSPKLTGYTAATLSSSRSTRDPVPSGLYQRSPTRSPVPRMAITPRSVIMNRSERSHSAMSTHSIGGGSQHSVSRTSSTSRAWKPSGLNINPLNGACTPSRVLQERLAQRKRTAELRGRSVQSKAQVQDYSGRSRSANSGLIVLPGGGRNYRDGNIATRRVVRGPEPQLQGSGINVVTSSIASESTSRLHTGRRLLHPPASKPSGDLGSQEFPKPKGTGQYAATQQTAATMRSVLWRVGSSSAIKKV